MAELSPIPYRVPLIDQQRLVSRNWQQWLQQQTTTLNGLAETVDELRLLQELTPVALVQALTRRLQTLEVRLSLQEPTRPGPQAEGPAADDTEARRYALLVSSG